MPILDWLSPPRTIFCHIASSIPVIELDQEDTTEQTFGQEVVNESQDDVSDFEHAFNENRDEHEVEEEDIPDPYGADSISKANTFSIGDSQEERTPYFMEMLREPKLH
ncbi:hypothetical protein R1flu_028151 [Riccia fluitans]|uniref:Uncharacterized protein n=1 Tax=Riccia fluitans TaxID=41844 RepID=A0ABD1XKV3_9MARC